MFNKTTTSRDIYGPDFTLIEGTEIQILNKVLWTHEGDLLVCFKVLSGEFKGQESNILASDLF